MNFTVTDLGIVYDYVVPCFPAEYNIFKLYEEYYKHSVENRIMKFLDDDEAIKSSPGVLIALTGWLDGYELLLKKTGVEITDHSALREV